MSERPERVDLDDWDGAIGPASAVDPEFHEFDLREDGDVLLRGPGVGMLRSFGRERFEELVVEGVGARGRVPRPAGVRDPRRRAPVLTGHRSGASSASRSSPGPSTTASAAERSTARFEAER